MKSSLSPSVRRRTLWGVTAVLALLLLAVCYLTLSPLSYEKDKVFLVEQTDNLDTTAAKLADESSAAKAGLFRLLVRLTGSQDRLRVGRYGLSGTSALQLLRNMRNGSQLPVRLVLPVLHTTGELAEFLGRQLEQPADSFLLAFSDSLALAAIGTTPERLPCMLIPNTYEVYWTASPQSFLTRMKKESEAFWSDARKARAEALGLSTDEVITLASIVEQETAAKKEKATIAGLYLNRLHSGMPLQADPTVKFAVGDFTLRRITNALLKTDSPYNTYRHAGLPPGPICLPSVESIDAVLNAEKHRFIYMCANPDFSNTHVFTENYSDHQKVAAAYAAELNKRGILK